MLKILAPWIKPPIVKTSLLIIAWGIGTLFTNFDHARWMGKKGREAVEKAHSWDTIADQTLNVYSS